MLSRVADRIFWMSRQMERAENMARILGVTSNLVLFGTKDAQQQKTLLEPLSTTETDEEFYKNHKKLTLTALLDFMALDESNPSSIYSCLKWARENAHAVRWQITSEMWETLNATCLELADNTARILDVKYHILLPRVEDVGGALDYYQWAALLRSVSAFETYRSIYRDQIYPIKVAELLILDRRMPR